MHALTAAGAVLTWFEEGGTAGEGWEAGDRAGLPQRLLVAGRKQFGAPTLAPGPRRPVTQ